MYPREYEYNNASTLTFSIVSFSLLSWTFYVHLLPTSKSIWNFRLQVLSNYMLSNVQIHGHKQCQKRNIVDLPQNIVYPLHLLQVKITKLRK